jgi:F0F1-type ATP synthase membrane subunit b/b'
MTTPHSASLMLLAEQAATRALQAERTARAQVAQCEAEAARRVSDANASAQGLRERTEARIAHLLTRMNAQAEQRLRQIRNEQERLAGETGADAATLARLDGAIERLVSEIAGAGTG